MSTSKAVALSDTTKINSTGIELDVDSPTHEEEHMLEFLNGGIIGQSEACQAAVRIKTRAQLPVFAKQCLRGSDTELRMAETRVDSTGDFGVHSWRNLAARHQHAQAGVAAARGAALIKALPSARCAPSAASAY